MQSFLLFPYSLILLVLLSSIYGTELPSSDSSISSSGTILIESFTNPIHIWQEVNDPVMGGRSTGTLRIDQNNGVARFEGEVVDVPFLQVPGFIQARTIHQTYSDQSQFPDVSLCSGLQITVRTTMPHYYTGYRFSFGNAHAHGGKPFAFGYKTDLILPYPEKEDLKTVADGFVKVFLPFSNFTNFWDDATGDPIVTCHDNPLYCLNEGALRNLQKLAIWAEGVAGKVSLELKERQ